MKLENFFEQKRERQFAAKIQNADSIQEVLNAIVTEIEFYSVPGNEYLNDLTPSEAKIALAVLSLIRQLNSSDVYESVSVETSKGTDSAIFETMSKPKPRKSRYVYVAIGSGIGAGAAVFMGPIGAFVGAAIGAAGVTALMEKLDHAGHIEKSPIRPDTTVRIDTEALIRLLKSWMEKVDDIVKRFSFKPQTLPESVLHKDFPRITQAMQAILSLKHGDSLDKFIDEQNRQISSAMYGAGYEVKNMSEKVPENEYSKYYDIFYDNSIDTIRIQLEPVFKEREIIIKGELFMPKR